MQLSQYISVFKKNINIYFPRLFTGPLLLHIDITNRCNLKCQHCDVWKFKLKKDLDFKVFKKLIDEATALGLKFIAISGGEPLLHKDILKFISYSKKKGIYINLSTNGILLSDYFINNFKTLKLDSMTISMESIGENYDVLRGSKGNYPKLINNLRKLKKKKLNVHIGVCITDHNFKDLPNLLYTLNKMRIYKIHFYPFYYSPRNVNKNHILYEKRKKIGKIFTKNEINNYKKIVKKLSRNKNLDLISKLILRKSIGYFEGKKISFKDIPCYAPLFSAVIGFDGDVSPCWYSTKIMGNIYKDNFKSIWYSKDFSKIKNQIRNKYCSLTQNNCLITQREISARIDILFLIKNYGLNFFSKYTLR